MLLQVLLLLYKVELHANGFATKSSFLHEKKKFECEAFKIYIAPGKKKKYFELWKKMQVIARILD